MLTKRFTLRVFVAAMTLAASLSGSLLAQAPNCGFLGSDSSVLPTNSGTLPGLGEISLGGEDDFIYVLTQWGFARGSVANPADPTGFSLTNIGKYHGNGGVIQISCDCHQGSNTMSVTQAPDGTSRMISDWQPFKQGQGLSGLAAQMARTTGTGNPSFGQQIDLPNPVAGGGRLASIFVPPNHFYGYFPVSAAGVHLAVMDNPSGSINPPLSTTEVIGWASGSGSAPGVLLKAAHVSVPGYDKYLLIGATSDLKLHVAEINPATGIPNEVASGGIGGGELPDVLDIAVVSNQIFFFSAGRAGLRIHRFAPPSGVLTEVGSIAGDILSVAVRGPQPFPGIFIHRLAGNYSYIDIYDTKWLVQGGSKLLAATLPHADPQGSVGYIGNGFDVLVQKNGSAVTAYLYRLTTGATESMVRTDVINISCIAADPTSPPSPAASMTNLSAAARVSPENTKNYFGDRWQIKDASVSFQPITQIDWDFHQVGSFTPEVMANPPGIWADINPAYWPCDVQNGGTIQTGNGCYQSLGAPTSSYRLGEKTYNINGPGTPVFDSGNIPMLQPQISIVGFDGTSMSVLSGGTADARPSQGNTAEATFAWTFTPGGAASGINPPLPAGAASSGTFSVTATYKGGYVASKNGAYQQVDLVPNFSVTPNPVLINAQITLRNLMQKGSTTTLNSVDYAVTSSANPPGSFQGQLASTFNPVNGTATVQAPGTAGNFYVHLRYNFSGPGPVDQLTASRPFATTVFQFNPVLGVYKNANHTTYVSPAPGNPPTWNLALGTTYYLFDDEALGSIPHTGAAFYRSNNGNPSTSGDTLIGSASGAGPVTFAATPACSASSNCYIKLEVSGVVTAWKIVIADDDPPTCQELGTCPPQTPTLTLAGPTNAPVDALVQFTATATNFAPTSYTWSWGDTTGGGGGGGGGGNCPPGAPCPTLTGPETSAVAATNTAEHTYTAAGTYTVKVTAVQGVTSKTAQRTIVIGGTPGIPAPSTAYTIVGAEFSPLSGGWLSEAGRAITFTASEADPLATFAWTFGDGAEDVGRSVTHVWSSQGSKTITLTVTGGGTVTAGVSLGSIRLSLDPPSFQALMIPGAGSICSLDPVTHRCSGVTPTWATDVSITNPGTTSMTITLYFAAFSDSIPSDLSTLNFDSLKSFRLDGGQSYSAVDVIGAAEYLNRPGAGKGILLARFDGGNQVPIATTRVYFTSAGSSFGTALPSVVTGPYGQTSAQAAQAATGQTLLGLRNDSLYRFNVSLFNASSEGGVFHLDVFRDDGVKVTSQDFNVLPYSQAGVNDTDLFTPDPNRRYVIKATSSSGMLQAFASVLDRRNNDLVQVSDDTPRIDVAPGTPVSYYVSGVGRIEDPNSNTHWRSDLTLYNPSTLQRDLTLEYRYMPAGSTVEKRILMPISVGPGQGAPLDDIVGNFLDFYTPDDLRTCDGVYPCTIIGVLRVGYNAPTDVATAPLIIGGRIYADLSTGTAGMQLSTYTSNDSVSPGSASLVMPGAQSNLRFRTNVGIFSQGDLPTVVEVRAIRQDGTQVAALTYTLNDAGHTGAFAQIPITADTFPGIDGNAMTIKVRSVSGSPVGAYIVTVDQISTDTVFIQGKRVN